MNLFEFTSVSKESNEVERRFIDLNSVVYVEEKIYRAPEPEEGEEKMEDVFMAILHMNVTHDMQMIKKQSANGKPQEFTYALIPMTIRISGQDQVERLFECLRK